MRTREVEDQRTDERERAFNKQINTNRKQTHRVINQHKCTESTGWERNETVHVKSHGEVMRR